MIVRVIAAEFLKLKRSYMPLWTALIVLAASISTLFAFPTLSDPSKRDEMRVWGEAWAQALERGVYDSNFHNYLRFGLHMLAGDWGIIALGLVAAYLFASEFKSGTATTTFTLPVRREFVLIAKMLVLAVWSLGLAMLSVGAMIAGSAILGLDGFAWRHVADSMGETMTAVALLYLTTPVAAWLALTSRGYLKPMVYSVLVVMGGFGVVGTSISRWLPWYMPIQVAGTTYHPLSPWPLTSVSWAIAGALFVAGVAACVWRLDRADTEG